MKAAATLALPRWVVFSTCLCVLVVLAGAQVLAEDLTLRINDSQGVSGGLVAISIRTYAPRALSQGQLCLRTPAGRGSAPSPFAEIDSVVVFSTAGDAQTTANLLPSGELIIDFTSATGTVNAADGPLLAVYARLRSDLSVGQAFSLDLDLGATAVTDSQGNPVPVRGRSGELNLVAIGAPLKVSADAEDVLPGQDALLSVQTSQIAPWSSGFFELTYPLEIADGMPSAFVDPRYGNGVVTLSEVIPGRLQISLTSIDSTVNTLPGDVVQILLPIAATAPLGSSWPVEIVTASAEARDPRGMPIPLALENGLLEVVVGEVFVDGFEEGNLDDWSLSVP